MNMPPFFYKTTNGKIIKGGAISALSLHQDHYQLTQLRIYADRTIAGTCIPFGIPGPPADQWIQYLKKMFPKIKDKFLIRIVAEGNDENLNTIPLEDFKYLIEKKCFTQNYKGTIRVYDPLVGEYELHDINLKISDKDFIKSIEDIILELNNKPSSVRFCLNMLCEFLLAPKEKKKMLRKKLLKSYLDVPSFQRSKENPFYGLTIEMEAKAKSKTPVEDIIYKRKNRLDNYDDFVKVYDDGYFEAKYIEKQKLVFPNPKS